MRWHTFSVAKRNATTWSERGFDGQQPEIIVDHHGMRFAHDYRFQLHGSDELIRQ